MPQRGSSGKRRGDEGQWLAIEARGGGWVRVHERVRRGGGVSSDADPTMGTARRARQCSSGRCCQLRRRCPLPPRHSSALCGVSDEDLGRGRCGRVSGQVVDGDAKLAEEALQQDSVRFSLHAPLQQEGQPVVRWDSFVGQRMRGEGRPRWKGLIRSQGTDRSNDGVCRCDGGTAPP